MKRSISIAAALAITSSFLSADSLNLNIKSGWNLIGSNLDNIKASEVFEKTQAEIMWKYESDTWKAYYPKKEVYDFTTINSGDGFWVKSNLNATVSVNGDSGNTVFNFSEPGWYLISPTSGSIDLIKTFGDTSKFLVVWTFSDGKWSRYAPHLTEGNTITETKIGQGFWVKTVDTDVSLEVIMSELINGTVDLTGISDSDTSRTRNTTNEVILPPVVPDVGVVQVYDPEDDKFENPLLKDGVELDSNGNYSIKSEDFTDSSNADTETPYVVRVIAEKDGEKFELSALKTGKGEVVVDAISTTVKTQIIDTIKTMFGSDFKINEVIRESVDNLASTISIQIKEEVKKGDFEFKPTDFATEKEMSSLKDPLTAEEIAEIESKNDKLKLAVATSTASSALTQLETSLTEIKEKEILENITDLDITKSSTDNNIATLKYSTIVNFVKMGLPVHDGEGNIIVNLKAPYEEFSKLPGKEYKIRTVDSSGNEVKVGNDPSVRIINLEYLNNFSGREIWVQELKENLENPIVPFNVIKTLMANKNTETNLLELGNYLKTIDSPVENMKLFDTNPFEPLIGTELSFNIEKSVMNIFNQYKEDLMKFEIGDMQYEMLKDYKEGDIPLEDFQSIFSSSTSSSNEDLFNNVIDGYGIEKLMNLYGNNLAKSIKSSRILNTESDLMTFTDGFIIDQDTTITPASGISLINIVMETANMGREVTLEKKLATDVFNYVDTANEIGEIWVPTVNEQEINIDDLEWKKKLIVGIAETLTKETINPETNFELLKAKVKKTYSLIEEKTDIIEEDFWMEKPEMDSINTQVKFQLLNWKEEVFKAESVKIIPIIENFRTGERIKLVDNASIAKPVDNTGRFLSEFLINSPETMINQIGTPDENGGFHFTGEYIFLVNQGDKELFVGEFWLDVKEVNELEKLFVDTFMEFDPSNEGDININDWIDEPIENNYITNTYYSTDPQSVFYPSFKYNGDIVGENILEIGEGLTINPILKENLVGTLEEGSINIGIISSNWEESGIAWGKNNFKTQSDTNLGELKIGTNIFEGGLISINVISPKLGEVQLIGSIDYVSENNEKMQLSIFPKPYMPFDFVGDTPVCYTKDGIVIDLPQRTDGSFPFPGDKDFPTECNIENIEKPTCPTLEGEIIDLPQREDGSYPYPGDSDFPTECNVAFNDGGYEFRELDCNGKEYPKDQNGSYIYPSDSDFNLLEYNFTCYLTDKGNEYILGKRINEYLNIPSVQKEISSFISEMTNQAITNEYYISEDYCPSINFPVCGVNEQEQKMTFANECLAAVKGFQVDYKGTCDLENTNDYLNTNLTDPEMSDVYKPVCGINVETNQTFNFYNSSFAMIETPIDINGETADFNFTNDKLNNGKCVE